MSKKLPVLKSGTGIVFIKETKLVRRLSKCDPELKTNKKGRVFVNSVE